MQYAAHLTEIALALTFQINFQWPANSNFAKIKFLLKNWKLSHTLSNKVKTYVYLNWCSHFAHNKDMLKEWQSKFLRFDKLTIEVKDQGSHAKLQHGRVVITRLCFLLMFWNKVLVASLCYTFEGKYIFSSYKNI